MVTIHDGEQSAANGIWCARFAHSSVFTYGDAHARPALTNQPYIRGRNSVSRCVHLQPYKWMNSSSPTSKPGLGSPYRGLQSSAAQAVKKLNGKAWRQKHLLQPQFGWSSHEFVGRAIAGFDRKLSAHNTTFNKKAILKFVHIESECYPPHHYQKQGRLRWTIGFHCSYKWVPPKAAVFRPYRIGTQRKGKPVQTSGIKEEGLFGGLSKRE